VFGSKVTGFTSVYYTDIMSDWLLQCSAHSKC